MSLALLNEHNINPEEIEKIHVLVSPENEKYPGGSYKGPYNTIDQALLSKPFSIAAALKYHTMTVDRYLSDMNEPELLVLANKVHTKTKSGMQSLDVEIEIAMKDGTILRGDGGLVDRGNHFLDKEHAKEKFRYLTANSMKEEEALSIVNSIYDLPKHKSIHYISALVKGAVGNK